MLNQLTPEHVAPRATVKRFIAERLNPGAVHWESEGIFPALQIFKGTDLLDPDGARTTRAAVGCAQHRGADEVKLQILGNFMGRFAADH
jgi:hypothetical protein